ncbi:MAG: aldo/keto reductase [Deltaproteobacteria bacterium]|nr:aldo/keto reductase [Deltaproteobacteria bacterium]
MEMRPIGNTGLQASVVGLGCNNFGMTIDIEATRAVLNAAFDAGLNFFDTADMYGGTKSEAFMGEILKPRRKDIILATKFGGMAKHGKGNERWGTKAYITQCIDASLKRLQTDYVDLYQMHYPDPQTPIEETLGVLNDLVKQGKVRAIGHSNFTGAQIDEATTQAKAKNTVAFATAQNEWSLLNRSAEKDVIPACDRQHVGQLPYFPIANGLLSGKYRRGEALPSGSRLDKLDFFKSWANDDNFNKIEKLEAFAKSRGHSLLELAMSWLASQPCVTSVIAGATKPEQIRANAAAANWRLTAAEMAEVSELVPLPSA